MTVRTRAHADPIPRRIIRSAIVVLLVLAMAPAVALQPLTAQGSTPVATPGATPTGAGEMPSFLFVQVAEGGTFQPTDTPDVWELVLTGAGGTTLAFADRPAREVHTLPTQEFLDGIGFEPTPPNAVLATGPADGDLALVLVLLGGSYNASTSTLTYRVQPLAQIDDRVALSGSLPEGSAIAPPADIGASSLFIDSDQWDWCARNPGNGFC